MFVNILILICFGISPAMRAAANVLYAHHHSSCSILQWQCKGGSCIDLDWKCDGKVDCADKSDETEQLCRHNRCPSNVFRCTYGACVDAKAPCNGVVECADKSDELLPKCKNGTTTVHDKFRCDDGSFIRASDMCNGIANCPDWSDESDSACEEKTCPPHLFKCDYGECVKERADCDREDGTNDEDFDDKILPAVKLRNIFNAGKN